MRTSLRHYWKGAKLFMVFILVLYGLPLQSEPFRSFILYLTNFWLRLLFLSSPPTSKTPSYEDIDTLLLFCNKLQRYRHSLAFTSCKVLSSDMPLHTFLSKWSPSSSGCVTNSVRMLPRWSGLCNAKLEAEIPKGFNIVLFWQGSSQAGNLNGASSAYTTYFNGQSSLFYWMKALENFPVIRFIKGHGLSPAPMAPLLTTCEEKAWPT